MSDNIYFSKWICVDLAGIAKNKKYLIIYCKTIHKTLIQCLACKVPSQELMMLKDHNFYEETNETFSKKQQKILIVYSHVNVLLSDTIQFYFKYMIFYNFVFYLCFFRNTIRTGIFMSIRTEYTKNWMVTFYVPFVSDTI